MQLQRANIPQITTWIEQQNEDQRLANAPKIAAEDVADQQQKTADEQTRAQEEAARKALALTAGRPGGEHGQKGIRRRMAGGEQTD